MPGGPAIEAPGLKELARDLRRIDPRISKEMSRAHKEVSTDVARKAAAKVTAITDASGRGAAGIRPRATANKAPIALLGSNPFVRAAVMGANTHWVFGHPTPQESMRRRVWQPWVGNDWEPESGLYGVSPAIAEAIPSVLDTYADRMMDALAQAFPEGG
jgi:hypothetical protein